MMDNDTEEVVYIKQENVKTHEDVDFEEDEEEDDEEDESDNHYHDYDYRDWEMSEQRSQEDLNLYRPMFSSVSNTASENEPDNDLSNSEDGNEGFGILNKHYYNGIPEVAEYL